MLEVSSTGSIHLDGRNLHVDDALQNAVVALARDSESGLIAVRVANVKLDEYKIDQKDPRLMYPGYYNDTQK